MNPMKLSVEAYDRLVDSGEFSAWSTEEARALSASLREMRGTSKPGPKTARTLDSSGELREACRKIMAYKLKRPVSRKPQVGLSGLGRTWDV